MILSDNLQAARLATTPLRKFTFVALLSGTLAITGCHSQTQTNNTAESDISPTVSPVALPQPEHPIPAKTNVVSNLAIEEVIVTDANVIAYRAAPEHEATAKFRHAPQLSLTQSMQHHPEHGYPIVPPRHNSSPDRERYPTAEDNPVRQVTTDPVSTFSIDVDTAAYANTRRTINAGQMPNRDAVRVEEFINYFNYSYAQPKSSDDPFSVTTEVGPSPWNSDRKLMLVGLQGYDVDRHDLPPANLVFLIDVSGSMNSPRKLGLLKASMKLLTRQLRAQDTISIAVYAGAAGQVLEPTPGNKRQKILAAIDALHAGGSTNGGAGINLAYALAEQQQKADGINRVILATDGDFNVGTRDTRALGQLIETKRDSGVSLTVLGFGAGNYNDATMQELAQKGNGNAAYIDTLNEARKVLVDELGSTLQTIAKDVKIQVEFNPALVTEYRLIGYETRHLNREDFNNDKIDAGEIGAGHSVTALYELTMADAEKPTIDALRYGTDDDKGRAKTAQRSELAHVKLRYKAPNGHTSKLIERVVSARAAKTSIASTSENYRFAAAASAYGQLLRHSNYTKNYSYTDALALAQSARGDDQFGYRREFESLLRTTDALLGTKPGKLANDPERISMR